MNNLRDKPNNKHVRNNEIAKETRFLCPLKWSRQRHSWVCHYWTKNCIAINKHHFCSEEFFIGNLVCEVRGYWILLAYMQYLITVKASEPRNHETETKLFNAVLISISTTLSESKDDSVT